VERRLAGVILGFRGIGNREKADSRPFSPHSKPIGTIPGLSARTTDLNPLETKMAHPPWERQKRVAGTVAKSPSRDSFATAISQSTT